jgi:hypothetical protein
MNLSFFECESDVVKYQAKSVARVGVLKAVLNLHEMQTTRPTGATSPLLASSQPSYPHHLPLEYGRRDSLDRGRLHRFRVAD